MKLTSEIMINLTSSMPMKQIDVDGIGYLQRYYAGTFRDGKDLWLHRFLSSDGDRHLHSHPYNFTTVMLLGGYTEEYRNHDGVNEWRITVPHEDSDMGPEMLGLFLKELNTPNKHFGPPASCGFIVSSGGGRDITVFDWHRIAKVEPETWTAIIVDPQRLPMWFFADDNNNLESIKGSPRDWHKNYGTRDEQSK